MFNVTKTLFQTSPRSLLIAAVCLHLTISIGTFVLARAQVFPAIEPDGVIRAITPDSLDFICYGELLADRLRAGDLRTWANYAVPLNAKLYSLSFVLLTPLLGMCVLAGEPINLPVYIAILVLVFKIGSTVFDRQVGVATATVVAIWPSFLLHTTQLVKDQFFIAALLLIVLIMIRWLTKPAPSFVWSFVIGIAGALSAYVIGRTRTSYWALLSIIFIIIGLVLLLIRQLRERQLFIGHMFTAVPILIALLFTYSSHPTASMKVVPSPLNPPTAPRSESEPPEPTSSMTVKRRLDLLAVRVWQFRGDFERSGKGVGSLDKGLVFANAEQLAAYVPRATMLGFLSPFPNQWSVDGRQTGRLGRLVAAAEMFVTYIFYGLAAFALWRAKRELTVLLLASISVVGVTIIALIVTNLGTLYRMRYGFLILLLPLAMKGLLSVFDLIKDRAKNESAVTIKQPT